MTSPRNLLVGFLWLLCALAAPAAWANGVDQLERFYNEVDSLSADFSQRQTDENGQVLQEASGIFLLSRPDRFRWSYRAPYEQIIVSDGDTFSFYDVDLAQVTIRDIDTTLRATPALLLTGGAALEDAFDVTAAGQRDGMSWVRLTPRADDSDFSEIRLGLASSVPQVMELDDNLGQTTRIRFDNVELDPAIPAERFSLDIPDGVEVVDGRQQAGRSG